VEEIVASATPEPGSFLLMLAPFGLLSVWIVQRRAGRMTRFKTPILESDQTGSARQG
jgi:hypothetical protein